MRELYSFFRLHQWLKEQQTHGGQSPKGLGSENEITKWRRTDVVEGTKIPS